MSVSAEASLAAAHEAQREHEEHELDDEDEWKAAPNPDLSEAVSRKNDAMIRAVETGDVAAVQAYIKEGYWWDARRRRENVHSGLEYTDNSGPTALMVAAEAGQTAVVAVLLQKIREIYPERANKKAVPLLLR